MKNLVALFRRPLTLFRFFLPLGCCPRGYLLSALSAMIPQSSPIAPTVAEEDAHCIFPYLWYSRAARSFAGVVDMLNLSCRPLGGGRSRRVDATLRAWPRPSVFAPYPPHGGRLRARSDPYAFRRFPLPNTAYWDPKIASRPEIG